MIDIDIIIANGQRYIWLYPFLIALIRYRIFLDDLKIFSFNVFFFAIIQVAGTCLSFSRINNLFLFHIYSVGSVTLLSIYYGSIMNEFIKRKWIITIIIGFAILAVLNAIYLQPLNTFPTYTLILAFIIILFLIFLSMYERAKQPEPTILVNAMHYKKNSIPFFFINTGLTIYHTCSVPLLMCVNKALQEHSNNLALEYWTWYRVVLIIMHLFIGTGLLVYKAPGRYIDPDEFPDQKK